MCMMGNDILDQLELFIVVTPSKEKKEEVEY